MTPQALSSCPEERLRNTVSMLCWALASVLLFRGLFQFLSSSVFQILGLSGSVELRYLVSCCTSALSVFLPVLLYLKLNRLPFSAAFPRQGVPASLGAPVILGAAGFCLFANIPANAVANLQHALGLGTFSGAAFPSSVFAQVLYAILVAVVAPLCEEFFFRGLFLQRLRPYGNWFAILASSLFFALFHGNSVQFVFAFLCGIALSFAVVKTGNLWISIAIHMLVNSVSVLGNFLSLYAGYEIGSLLYQISCWAGGLLALILFASALAKGLRPLSLDRGILPELSRSRRAGMLFGNTGAIAIILYGTASAIFYLVR